MESLNIDETKIPLSPQIHKEKIENTQTQVKELKSKRVLIEEDI